MGARGKGVKTPGEGEGGKHGKGNEQRKKNMWRTQSSKKKSPKLSMSGLLMERKPVSPGQREEGLEGGGEQDLVNG